MVSGSFPVPSCQCSVLSSTEVNPGGLCLNPKALSLQPSGWGLMTGGFKVSCFMIVSKELILCVFYIHPTGT